MVIIQALGILNCLMDELSETDLPKSIARSWASESFMNKLVAMYRDFLLSDQVRDGIAQLIKKWADRYTDA